MKNLIGNWSISTLIVGLIIAGSAIAFGFVLIYFLLGKTKQEINTNFEVIEDFQLATPTLDRGNRPSYYLIPIIKSDNNLTRVLEPNIIPNPTLIPECKPPERVLLIVIDGLRSDAVWKERAAPYLLELAKEQAAYTWNAKTVGPSLTIPAHTSLFTGYDTTTHGILDNKKYLDLNKLNGIVLNLPTIFSRLKDEDKNSITVIASGKKQIKFFLQPSVSVSAVHDLANDEDVFIDVQQLITNFGFDLMYIDFGFADITGHDYNWMSKQYLNAVTSADKVVNSLISFLKEKGLFDTTLMFILADHGGNEDYHSINLPENRTIPWMVLGPCVLKGKILDESDIRIFDTAPTIMWLLGLEIPENLDGRVISEAFEGLPDPQYGPSEMLPTPP